MTLVQSKQVTDFEQLLDTSLENFISSSKVLGEPVSSLALKVKDAFLKARDLIQYGLSNQEPSQQSPIMESYFNTIKEIVDFREKKSEQQFFNHLATVREAICALGWISVKPAPTQHIRDMTEAGQYYANRVLLSNKGNKDHILWVNNWNQLLVDLQNYVKSNFLTGFTWGADATRAVGRVPPPPPPPPPPEFASAGGDDQRQALLNDLNQGAAITRNLKPVNRTAPVAGQGTTNRPIPCAGRVAPAKVYPPKFLLEGRKWIVEHQKSRHDIVVPNDDMSQSLAVYKCEDSSMQVTNKMNGVVIDSCKRINVNLKSIISSVELIRCERVKIQCDGNVPLINLDNCDSVQIFVTAESRNVEIISSKSNSCNVCILETNGDYKEISIPEQIKTVLIGEKLVSTVVEKI